MATAGKSSETERRRKLRESLKTWYDVKEDEAPGVASALPAAPEAAAAHVDPEREALNIDSANFSASKFTTDMLQRKNLADIVNMDNYLRREVKTLDTNLKELVYDNYSKFISATDTIRQVRVNVADMDSRLEALSKSVSAMDSVSQVVTCELSAHRERIESVLSMNTVLRKLQFLVKLPNVLSRAISTGRLVDGVKYWVAGDAVLSKYGHIPAFKETHQNSRVIAEELYAALCADVLSRCVDNVPSPVVAKAEGRHTGDKAADADSADAKKQLASGLQKAYESLRLLTSTTIDVSRAAAKHPTAFAITPQGSLVDAVYAAVSNTALVAFKKGFQNAEAGFRDDALKRANIECANACKSTDFTPELLVCLERSLSKEALDRIHHHLLVLHGVLSRVLTVLGAENITGGVSVSTVIMSAAQPLLSSLLDTYRDVTSSTFSTIATSVCSALARRCVVGNIISAESCRTALLAVANVLATSAADFATGVRNIAKDNLRSEHFDHVKSFEGLIDATLVDALRAMHDRFRALCDPASLAVAACPNGTVDPFGFALAYSGVAKLVAALVLPKLRESALVATDEAFFKEYRDKFEDCSRRFANTAIIIQAALIRDHHILVSFGDVKGPTTGTREVVRAWTHTYAVCDALLLKNVPGVPAPKAGSGPVPTHRRTNSNTGSASALSRTSGDARASSSAASSRKFTKVANHIRKDNSYSSDVDRLFAKPSGQALFLRPSTVDATHVLECIIVATLVFWVDVVRDRMSLNNNEFQQLQVDAAFVLAAIGVHRDWYRREDRWAPLMDEAVTSAFERTVERIPMPADAVLNVINNLTDLQ